MRQATYAFAMLVALATLFGPSWHAGRGAAAAAATPTPAALIYDEITRVVIPPATPPAPGAFPADYQSIVSAPKPAPQKHGLGSFVGSVLGGNPGDAMAGANQMMAWIRTGHLIHYTYYKGWIRTDDPVAQTATIQKCEQHQYIALDLAKKTYTLTNTQPACPTPMMPMGGAAHRPDQAPSGTADMNLKATSQNLGPLTIDGIATDGSDHSMEMSMTNATGSCHDGDFKVNMTQYVSGVNVPRRFCPLPRTMGPAEMVSMQGGCKPTMHVQTAMPGLSFGENVLGRLVIYSRMSFGGAGAEASSDQAPPSSRMNGMMTVTQRGNVTWLGGPGADALFEIPPGFTQSS